MVPFRIEVLEAKSGVSIVKLAGRLNAASSPETKQRLKELVARNSKRLVLDLSELSFIDSSGLSALVAGFKAAAEAGGGLKLAGMTSQVSQVFSLTHLDRVFESYPEAEAALLAFGRKP